MRVVVKKKDIIQVTFIIMVYVIQMFYLHLIIWGIVTIESQHKSQ